MRYTRGLISFVILTILVSLGSLMLSTDQVRADLCEVIIEKEADPADDTQFNFSVNGEDDFGVPIAFMFTLMDPSNTTETLFINSFDNTATTVTEEVPPGWILDNIECTEPGGGCGGPCLIITEVPNGLTFDCLDSIAGVVTCTFFNVRIERNIPTLSEWGLIALAGILGIVGFMVIRRRKVTA